MTVDQLRQVMSNEEFVRWTRYLARRAQKRQLAAMMQAQGR